MVVVSGFGTEQIKANEDDKLVREDTLKDNCEESAYILDCKNTFIYNVIHKNMVQKVMKKVSFYGTTAYCLLNLLKQRLKPLKNQVLQLKAIFV